MSHSSSNKAILYAFLANLGIAITKAGAAAWTGSGSMLAEAIHSFADCGNQVLLFIGIKRSAKEATPKHPMGFERESHIWSLMVAIVLFSVGGMFSLYEGWLRYTHPHEVENAGLAIAILIIAVALESVSLKGALDAMATERGDRSLWRWFKETHSTELMVVTGEDIAALAGLVLALIMLSLTLLTGDTVYDALGSILIGLLLIIVAAVIGKKVHSLLLGESAEKIQTDIKYFLQTQDCIRQVLNIWAIYHGNSIMLAVKAEFQPDLTVAEAVQQINRMEKEIKHQHSLIKWIFFELDDKP
jgi:cation diffusion facilitator family transporter